MTRAAVLVAALVAALGGCVTDARPDNCAAAAVTVELAVSADAMTPDAPGVCRDQTVRLVIDSTVDGYFHIHGYDEALPVTEVHAGDEVQVEFVADRSGQFTVELHPEEDPEGVEIGVFTVYEP